MLARLPVCRPPLFWQQAKKARQEDDSRHVLDQQQSRLPGCTVRKLSQAECLDTYFSSSEHTHTHIWSKTSRVLWDGKLLWDCGSSFNLSSSQLRNENTAERISTPTFQWSYFIQAPCFCSSQRRGYSAVVTTENTGEDSQTIFLYRCWGHPEGFDSGSRQRWWCGLSGVGVKATSDPWLTWRTPTITTISSEKWLCGYVQSLESTSHRTTSPISHRANGGADM